MTSILLVVLVACGGGQSPPGDDDDIVNPPDGDLCDGDFGQFVTGELIDWDSTTASFQGVFDAKLTFGQDPEFAFATPPNGRLDFCLKLALPDAQVILDLDGPGDHFDGVMYLEREALRLPTPVSIRAFTHARAQSFFVEQGLPAFDPAAAQIVVLMTGDRTELTIDRTHADTRGGNEDGNGGVTWGAGNVGRYVLFPNVDATMPTATIMGDLRRTHVVPIAPGKLTLAVISFVFIGP